MCHTSLSGAKYEGQRGAMAPPISWMERKSLSSPPREEEDVAPDPSATGFLGTRMMLEPTVSTVEVPSLTEVDCRRLRSRVFPDPVGPRQRQAAILPFDLTTPPPDSQTRFTKCKCCTSLGGDRLWWQREHVAGFGGWVGLGKLRIRLVRRMQKMKPYEIM